MTSASDDQPGQVPDDDPLAIEEHSRAIDPRDNTSEASRVPEGPDAKETGTPLPARGGQPSSGG